MRVLVVEDEQRWPTPSRAGCGAEGMAVDVAYDGDAGHEKSTFTRYDVVVLDRDLPGMHGDDLCARSSPPAPPPGCCMLTASGTLADQVDGLSLGADDYLAKPFAFPELVARCRRSAGGPRPRRRRAAGRRPRAGPGQAHRAAGPGGRSS